MSLKLRMLVAIFAILAPVVVLVLTGCGILAAPVTGPAMIIKNMKHLKFDVEIVDESENQLSNVTVDAARIAVALNPIFVQVGDHENDPARKVNGTLTYESFGKAAVLIRFSPEGFGPAAAVLSE